MRYLIIISAFLFFIKSNSQNVKLEISNYHLKSDEKTYFTYQYANASYSGSRPTVVFVTNKDLLIKISSKLNDFYTVKQEYTDVWILGIEDFDGKNISESDKKIIDNFFQGIIKYRFDNSLPPFTKEQLNDNKIVVTNFDDICRYIFCRKR